ncbi:uncharacterized protein LOC118202803 [Stegodyphus dumicola]|uniref:uncharacterized protein LOC118202803 n=1 Tax=Stegodyphus dumicola TaxID=202533 RepID=UPI0015AF7556|nr:uncharacterized protein LOC118202803 [Stegodyphus dumicola]
MATSVTDSVSATPSVLSEAPSATLLPVPTAAPNSTRLQNYLEHIKLELELAERDQIIANLKGQNDSLNKIISLLEPSTFKDSPPLAEQPPCPAERQSTVVQRRKKKDSPPKRQQKLSDHVLLVSSKDRSVSPRALQEKLATTLVPKKVGTKIQQIRPTRANELLIRCATEEHLCSIKDSITSHSKLSDLLHLRTAKPICAGLSPGASSTADIAKCILSSLFQDDDATEDTTHQASLRYLYNNYTPGQEHTCQLPTLQEITNIIRHLNIKNAPGPDGLDSSILRMLLKIDPQFLLNFIHACWKFRHFPFNSKLAEVVLFLKNGKDAFQPRSYRPICLIPSLSKLLERIILGRLNYYLSQHNILNDFQYGFRKGRSAEMSIERLLLTIQDNRASLHHTLVISIDIQGAFDSLWWPDIIDALVTMGCPSILTDLIYSYLQDRRVRITLDGSIVHHSLSKECPQGSCLGPILWTIVANSLLNALQNLNNCTSIAYADDFLLIVKGRSRIGHSAQPNVTLRTDSRWASCRGHWKPVCFESLRNLSLLLWAA